MSRRTPAAAAVALLLLAGVTAGCSRSAGSGAATGAAAAATSRPAGAAAAAAPTTARRTLRDGDTTDLGQLAATVSAGATGDAPWVAVMARLRAASWLASRYPGRYAPESLYADQAVGAARDNDRQSTALGVWLDEPLPRLIRVARTRDVGKLTELDVTLVAGDATVRGINDDQPRGALPGGTHRGLFVVGQDGPDGTWRIHSVVELQVADPATGQEPRS